MTFFFWFFFLVTLTKKKKEIEKKRYITYFETYCSVTHFVKAKYDDLLLLLSHSRSTSPSSSSYSLDRFCNIHSALTDFHRHTSFFPDIMAKIILQV